MPVHAITTPTDEELIAMNMAQKKSCDKQKPVVVVDHNPYTFDKKTANPHIGYVNVEPLCWKAGMSDFSYATDTTVTLDNDNLTSRSGDRLRVPRHWAGGIRIDAGFSRIYDWMMEGSVTYFHSKDRHTTNNPNIYTIVFPVTTMYDSTIKSIMTYQLYDLGLATNNIWGKSFIFKPYIAVRGVVIKSRESENFDGLAIYAQQEHDGTAQFNVYTKFWGVGPKLGFKGTYRLGNSGVELFGDGSATLAYGKNHIKIHYNRIVNDIVINDQNFREKFHDLKLGFQLLLGANYKYYFHNNKRAVTLEAAWETHYWLDEGNFLNAFIQTISQRSFLAYGITLGLGFEF
jgi:hypothetical protein